MNYWDEISEKDKENKKDIQEKIEKYKKELGRLEQKLTEEESTTLNEIKRLFYDDIHILLYNQSYTLYNYTHDGVGWSDVRINEFIDSGRIHFTLEWDGRVVPFVECDELASTRLIDLIPFWETAVRLVRHKVDKYQLIIDEAHKLAEKDNYARTFNEYMEEVE